MQEAEDDEVIVGGLECVICMCVLRDTLILPCRHLCLCQACADSLRYQASNCPICRSPFRALLHIKAVQKNSGPTMAAGEVSELTNIFRELVLIFISLIAVFGLFCRQSMDVRLVSNVFHYLKR